jgi:transposase
MANLLSMATIDAILTLHQRNWSIRRIANELGLHRDTVARHLQLHEQAAPAAQPAEPVPSAEGAAECKIGHPPPGAGDVKIGHPTGGAHGVQNRPPQEEAPIGAEAPPARSETASLCEPYRPIIEAKLAAGLTAQRIFQDLVREHGFTAKYHSVRRFVQRLDGGRPLPFRRIECAAGDEVQVDFGTGAPIVGPDGRRRRTHVFRIVLSHSRKGYSEAVYRQTTDEFIRCLENAFHHFGGLPKALVLDNLKAGVETPDWYDPELNPKLRAFADHYGLAVLPTRPRMPRHKGKIESGIGYVKGNALKGRVFASLEDENRHLLDWETTVADVRIHGTIRQQVGKFFAAVEQPALRPLPLERFAFFHEAQRMVHRDGHVEVAKAYYSVPPEYLARRVWVRWDGRVVRIFNDRLQPIATHVQHEPGRFSTHNVHIASEKISGVERGAAWLLAQTRRIGTQAAQWSEAVIQERGVEGVRVVQGLLALAGKHPSAALEKACAIALSYRAFHLKTIRTLLDRDAPRQESFAFLEEHPIIRNLAEYARLVHDAFQKEAER